ncbi:hypothetical protein JOM56_011945 [Amanita muscaria]
MAKPLSGDLRYDLATVLDEKFGYKGSFAYSENRPDAPNPLLTITDIGPISLPLSEIDAKRIIACITHWQAPFGLGTSTASTPIDKEVRDTWQIDSSLVSFQNPAWNSFLQSNTASICSGLGLSGGYDIQYKLHKLLLYETGSLFRRHQDTQKEDGMFATMVIVLPSQYTGGEIVVSHGSTSEVIEFSASCTSISVFSWYTDVMLEVKPIRSGYRLVLSYNLMRGSLSRPEVVPTGGDASELSRLHQILERWRTGGYEQLPEQRMVAYVLGHQYSESDLDMGQDALKGQDAHKVNQISWVAEMLGFELWLAKFKIYIVWEGGWGGGDDIDGEESWIPRRAGPAHMFDGDCTLKYFTDLKGNRVHGKIEHFQGLITNGMSDDQECERSYMGNEPSTTRNYHHHAALVIFNKEDMDRVMIIACGVEYGLRKLQTSLKQGNLTPEDRKIIDLLLRDIRMTESNWKVLAEFPLRLHDLDLWNKIIGGCNRFLIALKEELFLAWDMFGFQQIQSSYDAISTRGFDGYTTRADFIHDVKARAASLNEEVVEAWCGEQIVAFVKGFRPEIHSEKLLISIAKEDGIRFLKDFEGRRLVWSAWNDNNYEHIVKLFMSEKENIYASPANEPGRNKGEDLNQIFEDFLDKCIRGAVQYLYDRGHLPDTETAYTRHNCKKIIDNTFEVVELCIATKRVAECATLFQLVWDAKNDLLQKLMLHYIPTTLRLRTRLPELGTSLLLPPFATFARNVIRYFLSLMLGTKTHNPRPSPQMPPCKQSCSTCASLHEFLEKLYVPVQDFCPSRGTRKHFARVLRQLHNC